MFAVKQLHEGRGTIVDGHWLVLLVGETWTALALMFLGPFRFFSMVSDLLLVILSHFSVLCVKLVWIF